MDGVGSKMFKLKNLTKQILVEIKEWQFADLEMESESIVRGWLHLASGVLQVRLGCFVHFPSFFSLSSNLFLFCKPCLLNKVRYKYYRRGCPSAYFFQLVIEVFFFLIRNAILHAKRKYIITADCIKQYNLKPEEKGDENWSILL